jgi:hypothetical protein
MDTNDTISMTCDACGSTYEVELEQYEIEQSPSYHCTYCKKLIHIPKGFFKIKSLTYTPPGMKP